MRYGELVISSLHITSYMLFFKKKKYIPGKSPGDEDFKMQNGLFYKTNYNKTKIRLTIPENNKWFGLLLLGELEEYHLLPNGILESTIAELFHTVARELEIKTKL